MHSCNYSTGLFRTKVREGFVLPSSILLLTSITLNETLQLRLGGGKSKKCNGTKISYCHNNRVFMLVKIPIMDTGHALISNYLYIIVVSCNYLQTCVRHWDSFRELSVSIEKVISSALRKFGRGQVSPT